MNGLWFDVTWLILSMTFRKIGHKNLLDFRRKEWVIREKYEAPIPPRVVTSYFSTNLLILIKKVVKGMPGYLRSKWDFERNGMKETFLPDAIEESLLNRSCSNDQFLLVQYWIFHPTLHRCKNWKQHSWLQLHPQRIKGQTCVLDIKMLVQSHSMNVSCWICVLLILYELLRLPIQEWMLE